MKENLVDETSDLTEDRSIRRTKDPDTASATRELDEAFTVRQLADELMPAWRADVDEWFRWPPDLFALTSIILKTTGLYRYAVSPRRRKTGPFSLDWVSERKGRELRREWRRWVVEGGTAMPAMLLECRERVFGDGALLDCHGTPDDQLCRDILTLHALADAASSHLGLFSAPVRERSEFAFIANFHLAVTGSLSRLPRRHGFVLPKLRTPQRGLTVRSFSHHLSFHRGEAAVDWRTVPWIDQDSNENTLNVLAVPIPYEIRSCAFNACSNPDEQGDARKFQYFEFKPLQENVVQTVLALVRAAYAEINHLHLVVLPEIALTYEELEELRTRLVEELYGEHNIPVLVTGVRHNDAKRESNEVVISAFYADGWYELAQHKHHRWKLTASQIRQYAIAGGLNVRQQWWEAMDVPPRRLTFVVPNGWLSLCPLICEDLAQLEPVSDVIRGVGPTLVTAILLDGPQLGDRWPARYVGVLADDPGSSVLTVTSLGMARRSRVRGKPEDPTAVSWKDEESGWEPVRMEGDGAVLLTLNAEWRVEYTADGRSDHASAATFVLQGARCIEHGEFVPRAHPTPGARDMQLRTADDVRELTVLCYLVDAALDAPPDVRDELCRWALLEDLMESPRQFLALPSLIARIRRSLDGAAARGREQQWPRKSYLDAVALVRGLLLALDGTARNATENPVADAADDGITAPQEYTTYAPPIRRWKKIIKLVMKLLAQKDAARHRTTKLAYFCVLWAVHSRLTFIKRKLRPGEYPDDSTLYVEVRELLRVIENVIRDYSHVLPWELLRRAARP